VYSWVIPASSPTQGIHADWDGTNWRARTFGQEVVAPATQNNAAVQLGQVLEVAPVYSALSVGTPAASTTYTNSTSLTAPCDGFVVYVCSLNSLSNGPGVLSQFVYFNGTETHAGDSTASVQTASVTSGEAVTIEQSVTTGSTAPSEFNLQTIIFFIPNP
jgi:hypothetical protein